VEGTVEGKAAWNQRAATGSSGKAPPAMISMGPGAAARITLSDHITHRHRLVMRRSPWTPSWAASGTGTDISASDDQPDTRSLRTALFAAWLADQQAAMRSGAEIHCAVTAEQNIRIWSIAATRLRPAEGVHIRR
jgi:hypothetical protein